MQAIRCLTSKNNEVCAVHHGKIVRPVAIGHKNHAVVQVLDKLTGGGKKKTNETNQTQSGHSGSCSSEADTFFELMEKTCRTGKGWNDNR